MDKSAIKTASENFENHLRRNSYPGRGLVIGRTDAGGWVLVYWIMGRSANSRNRRFVVEGETLRTEPVDPSRVANPELIIYEPMRSLPGVHFVSNGDQTQTLVTAISAGETFDQALITREREPDAPNYTPRISGMLRPADPVVPITLSLLKANTINPALTDRFTYRPAPPPPGFGYGLTTYMGDGAPLPSFAGDPLLLPLNGSGPELLEGYWQALDVENRVSLAVKRIGEEGSLLLVKNRHEE